MNLNYLRKTANLLVAALLIAGMPFNGGVVSASELQTHYMSVQLENATLRELFDIIEEKFDYSFLIRNNDIDLNERVTFDISDKSVEEILTNALKKQNAEFVVNDNRIIVYKSTKQTQPETKSSAIAQQVSTIKGVVIDAVTNEPIIGANVIVKGTTTGTSTDFDGNFSFEAPEGATLVVSYIGYVNQEVIATSSPMTIRIKEDTKTLDEVVVVGYSVQRRESLTGALQTLNNEKLTNITTPSVENMLNGKAPGVYVAPGNGRPGSTSNIIIRGKASISGQTNPLWVIDGVIVGYEPNNSLNPTDIETMTILKDAASTAIYGSQGANGVIVVTTKKGKIDKLTVSASAKVGINKLSNGKFNVMNGAELYDYFKSFSNQEMVSFPRWNEDLRNANYSWWDLSTQTGLTQDYNISISGGSEKIKSYLSLGLYDEEGAVKGYDFKRYNFRYSTEFKPFEWLTIKPLIAGSRTEVDNKEYSVTDMYVRLPWDSPYLPDGTPTPHRSNTWVVSNVANNLYDLQWNHSNSAAHTFTGNFDFDIRITDWLTFSSVNNYTWDNYASKAYSDPRSNGGSGVYGRLDEKDEKRTRRYTNHLLRFNKMFGKHAVNGLIAYEFNDYKYEWTRAVGTGFISGFEILNATAKPERVAGAIQESAMQSYLFNANYAYDNKYLAQVSLRRDGASNFGDNAKYGNFFSVSGGWNVHREDFLEYDWIDVLKLRVAYGSVGNRPSSLYPQYDLYSVDQSYDEIPGALISQIGNRDLTWEKTYTFGAGVDFNIFDRFRISMDYYDKQTSNILFSVPITGLTGVTRVWQNVGEMNNKGFELALGVDILKTQDLYWGFDFNLGLNRNKVKKLYEAAGGQIIETNFGGPAGSISRLLKTGHSIDTWYTREWAGVNPEDGSPQWYTTDDNGERVITGKYNEADEVACGTFSPDFFGGFSTNLVWKNFDVGAVFTYSVGGSIYNYSRQEYDADGTYTDRNQMKLLKNWSRWEKPGDIATHPKPAYNNSSNANKVSSRYIEDADYLKLRSLSIGYNFALPQYYISNLRLFFSAENVFAITGYSGVDPELPTRDSFDEKTNLTTRSVVNVAGASVYPTTRKFMFGINITL